MCMWHKKRKARTAIYNHLGRDGKYPTSIFLFLFHFLCSIRCSRDTTELHCPVNNTQWERGTVEMYVREILQCLSHLLATGKTVSRA